MDKRTNILLTAEDQAIIARLRERLGLTTTAVIRQGIRKLAQEDDFERVPCFYAAGQRRREEVSDGDTSDADEVCGQDGQLDPHEDAAAITRQAVNRRHNERDPNQ